MAHLYRARMMNATCRTEVALGEQHMQEQDLSQVPHPGYLACQPLVRPSWASSKG